MTTQLCTIFGSGNDVARLTVEALGKVGLRVVQSFDLSSARAAHHDCSCTHHGTDLCDCQMIVLLVYGASGSPLVLTCHGRDGLTNLALAEESPSESLIELETAVIAALLAAFQSHIHLEALS